MFHSVQTSVFLSSAVDRFFSTLARRRRLKNLVLISLDECTETIETLLCCHNEHQARAFKWSKLPQDLID